MKDWQELLNKRGGAVEAKPMKPQVFDTNSEREFRRMQSYQ